MGENLEELAVDFKRAARSTPIPDPTNFDRLPPHSIPAEQGVIGCCLLGGSPSVAGAEMILSRLGEEFYDLRHRQIFEVLLAMHAANVPIDLITVQAKLKESSGLESVGGLAYLSGLMDSTPSPANLSYYAEIVKEKFWARTVVQAGHRLIGMPYEASGETVDGILDEAIQGLMSVRRSGGLVAKKVSELLHNVVNEVQDEGKGVMRPGWHLGWDQVDQMVFVEPGMKVLIAGRTSAGKTAFLLNAAKNVAKKCPTGIFSLEMTAESLTRRLWSIESGVNLRNSKTFSREDYIRLVRAADVIGKLPIYIDDTAGLSVEDLCSKIREMVDRFNVRMVFIDYVQCLVSNSRRARESRQAEMSIVSGAIRILANELRIGIVMACQMNREFEGTSRMPLLSDLRESGALEQDANIVMFLYQVNERQEAGGTDEMFSDSPRVHLYVAKNRDAPKGVIKFTFLKQFQQFEEVSKLND